MADLANLFCVLSGSPLSGRSKFRSQGEMVWRQAHSRIGCQVPCSVFPPKACAVWLGRVEHLRWPKECIGCCVPQEVTCGSTLMALRGDVPLGRAQWQRDGRWGVAWIQARRRCSASRELEVADMDSGSVAVLVGSWSLSSWAAPFIFSPKGRLWVGALRLRCVALLPLPAGRG
jgi:hypothetical protein